MEVKTFFKFNIIVRLLKVSDGSVIMTVKNTYAESEKDEYLPGYVTMDAYRNLVLKKMSNEIVDVLKSSSK